MSLTLFIALREQGGSFYGRYSREQSAADGVELGVVHL